MFLHVQSRVKKDLVSYLSVLHPFQELIATSRALTTVITLSHGFDEKILIV